jgi:hypothetical protein
VKPIAPPPSAGLGWTGLLTIAAMLLLLI